MKFTWDERKARRNERKHGVSFDLARTALDTRLGVEVEDQYREGEWRTKVLAPVNGILILAIIIASNIEEFYEGINRVEEEHEESDFGGTIRIISARKATGVECGLYFEARSSTGGRAPHPA